MFCWLKCFILNVEIDSGFYTVKFDSMLLKDVVVEADCVIPPLREDDPLSSDSDPDDTGDGEDVAYAKGVYELGVAIPLSITTWVWNLAKNTMCIFIELIAFIQLMAWTFEFV